MRPEHLLPRVRADGQEGLLPLQAVAEGAGLLQLRAREPDHGVEDEDRARPDAQVAHARLHGLVAR
eukprot:1334551-Alexandrium_andersonii.AAC.1